MPPRPQVLLVGDSISVGYHETAVAALSDVAEVTRIPASGRTSTNILEHLDEWIAVPQPDLIHLNCGLHDLARSSDRRLEPRTALDAYEVNVRRIIERLRMETRAVVIWASTTPVNDERHRRRKNFERRERDVQAYNKAAEQVMRELTVPINDLHALVVEAGTNGLLGPDGVHFGAEGYRRLGEGVARVVRDTLAVEGLVGA
jgi:lysophospholipase L1-like esterase